MTNTFQRLGLGILGGAVSLIVGGVAESGNTTTYRASDLDAAVAVLDAGHADLLQAVADTGTTVLINDGECYEGEMRGVYGFYSGAEGLFVICQENGSEGSVTRFTAEDLNTIRHEAQHLVQDQMDGVLDGWLDNRYNTNDRFTAWVNETVPSHRIGVIMGYDELDIRLLEAEAEAVAYDQTAGEIANTVRQFTF